MSAQSIINGKGEKTAVIVPISEDEDLLHQHHYGLELTDDYKLMMDNMLAEEPDEYLNLKTIEARFKGK